MPEGGASGDVVGVLDESNNILLSGNLADGTYTLKFENHDGTVTELGDLVVNSILSYSITKTLSNCTATGATSINSGSTATVTISVSDGYELPDSITVSGASYTWNKTTGTIVLSNPTNNVYITVTAVQGIVNLAVPNATNTSDWDLWCNNSRIGSDGKYRSASGQITTNWIEAAKNDVFYINGLTFTGDTHTIATYDSSKTIKVGGTLAFWESNYGDVTTLSDGIIRFTIGDYTKNDGTVYVRFSGVLTGTVNDVVITKNQPIS